MLRSEEIEMLRSCGVVDGGTGDIVIVPMC